MTPGGPPVLVLGVRRSGTTLLRVMLDRHSELAVPDESYFVPQLADRHLRRVDPDAFVDDLRRIDTLAEWNVPLDKVRTRLRKGMPIGAAIATVYAVYAEERGKERWGDKTPMYMQNLHLLERLFPDALFVHLIRDGRDAATSFLSMPKGLMTETWMQPESVAEFACQWRAEVKAARQARLASRRLALPRGSLRGARPGRRDGAATDLDVRPASVRAGDGGLRRERRGQLGEAAPAEPQPSSHRRPARLAAADVPRGRRRIRAGRRRPPRRARLRVARAAGSEGKAAGAPRTTPVRRRGARRASA